MAMNFSSSANNIVSTAASVLNGSTAFAVSYWIRYDAIPSTANPGTTPQYVGDGNFSIEGGGAGAFGTSNDAMFELSGIVVYPAWSGKSTAVFYHHAWNFLGGQVASTARCEFYISGTSVSDNAQTGTISSVVATTTPSKLGWVGNASLQGDIEDFRLFRRNLSGQEILTLAGGYRGPMGGEVLWWQLAEPRGTLSTTYRILDLSGNGAHGMTNNSSSIESNAPRVSGWAP